MYPDIRPSWFDYPNLFLIGNLGYSIS